MASVATRNYIARSGDFYLCPLNAKQASREELIEYLQPVWDEKQELTTIDYDYADGKNKNIAEGFERKVTRTIKADDDKEMSWDERQLVVRSFALAQTESQNLQQRLEKTSDALEQLKIPRRGKKRLISPDEWKSAVEKILKRYHTTGLFQIDIQIQRVQKVKRRYLQRPPQYFEESNINLHFQIDEDAVTQEIKLLGWRVYVTNQINTKLDLKQAVRAYRNEYLMERGFARLKGFPLSLTPIYLQREDHITGLIRLLSIGLRVLTLLEFQVRRNLNQNSEKLAGLYVGNPKRKTARPTAEIILAAFKEITLLLIEVKNEVYAHVTAFSPLQERILVLLGFSTTIYTKLGGQSFTPE